jgi:hypothetical protein
MRLAALTVVATLTFAAVAAATPIRTTTIDFSEAAYDVALGDTFPYRYFADRGVVFVGYHYLGYSDGPALGGAPIHGVFTKPVKRVATAARAGYQGTWEYTLTAYNKLGRIAARDVEVTTVDSGEPENTRDLWYHTPVEVRTSQPIASFTLAIRYIRSSYNLNVENPAPSINQLTFGPK